MARRSRSTGARETRVQDTRRKVVDAAAGLLAEHGHLAFTIDNVVTLTGVAKSTIYRHWATRRDLLVAVIQRFSEEHPLPDTGSVRRDLVQFFSGRAHGMDLNESAPWLRTLPSLIEVSRNDAEVGDHSRLVVQALLAALHRILEHGLERGELRPDSDLDMIANTLMGAIVMQRAFREQLITDPYIDASVDLVLRGCVANDRAAAAQE